MKTFRCDFGDGISCEVEIEDALPEGPSSGHIRSIFWSKKPTLEIVRPYIAWMNSVNKTLADKWNKKLMHIYEIEPNNLEVWVYEPGKPPKKYNQ